jgi:hypothetical protein
MEPEIVPADKRLRTLTLAAAALVFVAGVVMLAFLSLELRDLRQASDEKLEVAIGRLEVWTTVLTWTAGLSFVGVGAWMFALGWRVNRAGRYPLPGMKVVRDTRVRSGSKARTLANALQLAAFFLISAGVVGLWWLHQIAVGVLEHAGR